MNKFFNYYNSLCTGANTPNVFSYDPYIIAIKQMLVSELQNITYYIEKLKDLNVDMASYTDKVIDFIVVMIINLDFKKESVFIIMEDLYNNRKKLEKMYISACDKAGIEYDLLDRGEDYTSKSEILRVLNEHEKNLKQNNVPFDKNKKNLYEIIINLVLNACNCLIELKKFNSDFPQAKNMVLKLLNSSNSPSLNENDLIDTIRDFSKCNYQIMKLIYEKIVEKFGPVIKTKVPLHPKKGKAILVSGSSYSDLEKLLSACEKYDINVYTHRNMISAFQYEKLTAHPNLAGSYEQSENNMFIDFASFPGPIFVSKNAILKTDVIRGQIYTSAKYPAYGIGKIENDDFSPVIQYALEAKGFEKNEKEKTFEVGYFETDVEHMLSEIINKYNKKEINRILIIGLSDGFNQKDDYVKSFIKDAPKNDYIISFSYDASRHNFCRINSYYDYSLLYNIIEILFDKLENVNSKLGVFFADCCPDVISHIFNLISLDVNNIFLGPCCPNVINPVLYDGLSDIFSVNEITEPLDDIEKIS